MPIMAELKPSSSAVGQEEDAFEERKKNASANSHRALHKQTSRQKPDAAVDRSDHETEMTIATARLPMERGPTIVARLRVEPRASSKYGKRKDSSYYLPGGNLFDDDPIDDLESDTDSGSTKTDSLRCHRRTFPGGSRQRERFSLPPRSS